MSAPVEFGFRCLYAMFLPLVIAIPPPPTLRGGRAAGFSSFKNCSEELGSKRWESDAVFEGRTWEELGSTPIPVQSCVANPATPGAALLDQFAIPRLGSIRQLFPFQDEHHLRRNAIQPLLIVPRGTWIEFQELSQNWNNFVTGNTR